MTRNLILEPVARRLVIELDENMARELEQVAPARSRCRSAFVRTALRRTLDLEAERRMAEAYAGQPDDEPAYFDAYAWEPRTRR